MTPGLYLIATPIGNIRDITLRALDVLKEVDWIACEDTRMTQKLLQAYGIEKPLKSYHDHNEAQTCAAWVKLIQEGKSVALMSDAGMPLVADPGYKLVQACLDAQLPITCIPGPSAVLTALALSGLPPDRFAFLGFFDVKKFDDIQDFSGTLIFFEAPHRLQETLKQLKTLSPGRSCVIARELTKHFEEVIRGSIEDVCEQLVTRDVKGEIVLLLGPPAQEVSDETIRQALTPLLAQYSVKDAAGLVAKALHVPKKRVYQLALTATKH